MSDINVELEQVNREIAVAKYARYILADLRCVNPDLFGWYPDWDQYYTDALECTSLLDPEGSSVKLQYLPVLQRLYVDSPDERLQERADSDRELRASLRCVRPSAEEAFALFSEAMQDYLDHPPEGLLAEDDVYLSLLLQVRDPFTKRRYPKPRD